TASRQPLANSARSTYSLTVWISYWPAPMVTVGTPCLSNQLASRPPLENKAVGFRPSDSTARLTCFTPRPSSARLNGGYAGLLSNPASAVAPLASFTSACAFLNASPYALAMAAGRARTSARSLMGRPRLDEEGARRTRADRERGFCAEASNVRPL